MKKSKLTSTFLLLLLFLCMPLIVGAVVLVFVFTKQAKPIRVGILHSLTGPMAMSEGSVIDAAMMAIQELNKQGGVLNRIIEPVFGDGKSDDLVTFAKEAERLITQEHVEVIFGGWTSASRKQIKSVVEKYNNLLVYPLVYEGAETSSNIIYTGATPNQQIIPGINWCFNNIGKRMFIVSSDYVWPRVANKIIKEHVTALGGEIVGEEYLISGSKEVDPIIKKIQNIKPDVIINTLNGITIIYFFKALREAGISSQMIPTMSFAIAEPEVMLYGLENLVGDYATWSYFQTISNEENKKFLQKFHAKYGADRTVSDVMESVYSAVFLWAQAVFEAESTEVDLVLKFIKNKSKRAPEGVISIDNLNHHTWKCARIGKIREDGLFDIIFSLDWALEPIPYPSFYTKAEWEKFLADLYVGWGNAWSK